jgi:two-component system cell cycle sensor histidine kinase/response regulator CckA
MHILLLAENSRDRQLLEEILINEGLACQTTHTTSKEEFQKALEQTRFDLIISDFILPAYSGMAALAASKKLQPDTPFIFVSGTAGQDEVVESLKSGATDYVFKEQLHRLGPAARRALLETQERKERQRLEQQLRVQSSALETAANGIILTDKTGKIFFANQAVCAMTGYDLEEILGQTTSFIESYKHEADFSQDLWKTILAGRTWHGELINRRKDGTFYNEEMTITPVRESNGEINHFIAVKQDITQRKQLEEQVHHITKCKRLEEQSHQAQTMEVMSQFAGSIAHDFNNLLTVIHDHTKLALTDENRLGEQNRQQLKHVIAAAETAANLIRQLLAFGRKQAIQFQSSDLNQVIGNSFPMLESLIGAHIVLQCHYARNLPAVNVDTGMIEQILVNLIVNARDAMPQGGQLFIATESISLDAAYVETHFEARPGQFVCMTVRDTGTGIHPEYMPRIFEPFFTTKEAGQGAGLGLAIVHGIVKQHHGWITISSQLGKGTAFKIFLPANTSAAAKILIP